MEPLAKLFGSAARLKILRLFLFNQNTDFTALQITERTKLSSTVVRRELTELSAANLLRKKGERTAARYQVNPKFEHLAALDVFIRDTTNVHSKNIIHALKRVGTLRLVTLSGFFTNILESQIDLLVVGDNIEERGLAHVVHSLEAELGREIRYAFFATPDFRYRMGVYDRLLRDVFDYPHRLLIDKIGL